MTAVCRNCRANCSDTKAAEHTCEETSLQDDLYVSEACCRSRLDRPPDLAGRFVIGKAVDESGLPIHRLLRGGQHLLGHEDLADL